MKRWLAALALVACGVNGDGSGGRLPDLALAPLSGEGPSLELGQLEGPAVVNLWATWCAPCRRELPAFQTVSADRTDVRFVGVDIGERADQALDFLAELGVTFPQYADERGQLTDALGAAALPVTLVVGADGELTLTHLGPMSVEQLHEALDAAGA